MLLPVIIVRRCAVSRGIATSDTFIANPLLSEIYVIGCLYGFLASKHTQGLRKFGLVVYGEHRFYRLRVLN